MVASTLDTAALMGVLLAAGVLTVLLLIMRLRRPRRPAPGPSATPTVPCLKSSDGSLYVPLDTLGGSDFVIGRGRHGVHLTLPDTVVDADTVSEKHARIYHDARSGYVIIEDLNSTNGIYINGRRAPRKNLLRDGWTIGLGNVKLIYRDGETDTGPLE
jgi:pSer/pThr/pTyr-binding forkhead associated (FHA) protein